MIRDLYIIPVDQGEALPEHVGMLEFCRLKAKVEERCLLASCVVRAGAQGPSGSPLNTSSAVFSPSHNAQPTTGFGASPFPPNPYTATATPPQQVPNANPLVNEILKELQFAPTAMQVVSADPNIPREKLEHLRRIMEEDLETRTNLDALARRLDLG